MGTIIIKPGEKIPELEQGDYMVIIGRENKIIIPPLSSETIIKKIKEFRYSPNKNREYKNIYDIEKGALETIIIERQ